MSTLALALIVTGCANASNQSQRQPTSGDATLTIGDADNLVAEAIPPDLPIYADAVTETPSLTLSNPNEDGAPLVVLETAHAPGPGRIEVYLPVRPNGSTGWVRTSDVRVTHNPYRITVGIAAHRLVVERSGAKLMDEPVGIGKQDAPTPGGTFFITELLKPPNPDGPYGPYAYGLSGHSDLLQAFANGDGVIGIHGTNDPSSIGSDVSHGCIRLQNEAIENLARFLPLGTPVVVNP